MRLKITHTTEYRYDEPVQFSLQRLRLKPQALSGQKVLNWTIAVEGATVEVEYDDQFGNHVELVSTEGDQNGIRIVASGEVETEDRNGVFGQHLGYCPLWLFLRETPLTTPGPLTKDLLAAIEGETELAKLHMLMGNIHENVDYIPGATGTETTAEEALEAKKGVCQDHAHIFIAVSRLMGLPSRYVSGYLMMDEVELQSATHAWAETHIPGLGWVGFDAANDVCPDERYVRVATGLDYSDAAPVSGMRIGTAHENITVSVTVENQGQSQSQSQS